jgi:4-hydroxy-3-methylbut-2-enyl diphosphate reductase
MIEIYLAKHAGFCFGVSKAMRMAYDTRGGLPKSLYTFGELIHNRQVIKKLSDSGIHSIEDLKSLEAGSTVMIRAHGAPELIYHEADKLGLNLIDATCPYVKKVHHIVSDHCKEGNLVIIIGDPNHPEIIGVKGWCPTHSIVVASEEEIDGINFIGKVSVVAQTTLRAEMFDAIVNRIKMRFEDVQLYNTICQATAERQDSAADLSEKVDLMIVIGGKHSSNTKKLFEICHKKCPNAIHIETKDEILMKDIKKYGKIGVTAGASTPDWLINLVIDKLLNEGEGILMHEQDNSAMNELMEQFDENYNVPRNGKIVKGKIVMIGKDELIVNIGYKADGIIPRDEINLVDSDLDKEFAVDQELEAMVILKDNGEGNVLLSLKRMAAKQNWTDLEDAFEEKKIITVKVNRVVKGGLTAFYDQIRGFIPASHVDVKFVDNLDKFVGEELEVEVIEFNRKKNKIIFSRKKLMQKAHSEKVAEAWGNLEIGKVVTGVVRRFTEFGAFVDLGGIDGLLHVSEISWGKVDKPKDVLKKNQEIEVKILDFKREENKVSLSIKQMSANPWDVVDEKYQPEERYAGKVTSLTEFGAFVELEPGLEGLVHVSQISEERVEKPSDVLAVGQEVEVTVLDIDKVNNRIKLSMK